MLPPLPRTKRRRSGPRSTFRAADQAADARLIRPHTRWSPAHWCGADHVRGPARRQRRVTTYQIDIPLSSHRPGHAGRYGKRADRSRRTAKPSPARHRLRSVDRTESGAQPGDCRSGVDHASTLTERSSDRWQRLLGPEWATKAPHRDDLHAHSSGDGSGRGVVGRPMITCNPTMIPEQDGDARHLQRPSNRLVDVAAPHFLFP
jgi:hypothetical protein